MSASISRRLTSILAVANLLRNRHLARAISDAAWAEFARQLRYKAAWFGTELVICDRNAAANLAAWAETACEAAGQPPDRQAAGRFTNASGGKALAIATAMAEPTPKQEEPTLTPS